MAMNLSFEGKHVVITGGSNGIGAAMVRAFHQAGASVYFCGRDQQAASELIGAIGGEERLHFSAVSLEDPGAIEAWFAAIGRETQVIDTLINNAGADPRALIEETDVAFWDKIIDVNLRGYFLCCRQASPLLVGASSVINVSSITFDTGKPNLTAYVASKGGIIGLTRSLAREWGERGIRVNTLSPGAVYTERQLERFGTTEGQRAVMRLQALPTLVEVEAVADTALFLASPMARCITGQNLRVCNGWALG